MKSSQSGLRPQDVVVLAKLISSKGLILRQIDIANDLFLSQGEIAYSLERLNRANLVSADKKKYLPLASIEFLEHAVRYFYPPFIGRMTIGVPILAPEIAKKFVSSNDLPLVWEDVEGTCKGIAMEPIYETVPKAIKQDAKLYKVLSLIDLIRWTRGRQLKVAVTELRKIILAGEKNEERIAHY